MNDQQKEFTIKEIARYNENINSLYYKINRNTMFTVCGVALAVSIIAINSGEFSGNEIFDNFVSVSSTGVAVYNGVKAIQRICEKTSLEHTVRVLEHDVAISELDSSKQLVKENKLEVLNKKGG